MPIRKSYGYLKGPSPLYKTENILKFRDIFKAPPKLPASVDLTKWIPGVLDQGAEGSCVYNAWALGTQYSQIRSGGPSWLPSRQFGYWNGRVIQGTTGQDSGDFIHDAYHQSRYVGIIPESEWEYLPPDASGAGGNMLTQPPASCFTDAANEQQHIFAEIEDGDVEAMKMCIAHGFPFEDGFQVPDTFEDPSWNFILDTSSLTGNFVGGHGTLKMGYDDNFKTNDGPGAFLVPNSWGSDWGLPSLYHPKGFFMVSYKFIENTKIESDIWMQRFLNQQTSLT
jgi:hypothetical protein